MSYYSQWEQDKWLNEHIFHGKRNGVFIDVGAHDGISCSNSYFFEKNLNWTGICIEPIPEIFQRLQKNRACICVEGCAYNKEGKVNFTRMHGYCEMLSGIDEEYNSQHKNRIESELTTMGGTKENLSVHSYTLDKLCKTHNITEVDYLSIDVEGSEMSVLQGIDWSSLNIDIIDIEVNYKEDEELITDFLNKQGYTLIKKLTGDNIYRKIPPP